jgi:hypothetical protein
MADDVWPVATIVGPGGYAILPSGLVIRADPGGGFRLEYPVAHDAEWELHVGASVTPSAEDREVYDRLADRGIVRPRQPGSDSPPFPDAQATPTAIYPGMVDRALAVLHRYYSPAFMASSEDYTDAEIVAGRLTAADREAERRTRNVVRHALAAAIDGGAVPYEHLAEECDDRPCPWLGRGQHNIGAHDQRHRARPQGRDHPGPRQDGAQTRRVAFD